jgi:hypothetical protein
MMVTECLEASFICRELPNDNACVFEKKKLVVLWVQQESLTWNGGTVEESENGKDMCMLRFLRGH